MNKKVISMVTALAVGGGMLAGTAFTVMAQTSGYDVYKSAVRNIPNVKNATAKVEVNVTDNGNVILTANDLTKFNRDNNAMSTINEIKYASKDLKTEAYTQDGKRINKPVDSSVYTVIEKAAGKAAEDKKGKKDVVDNTQIQQSFEGIVDAYVGNRSNSFTATSNSDGSKTVTVKLDENQITPLDNAIVSFAVKAAGMREFKDGKEGNVPDLKQIVPQLTSDITVKKVDVTAVIGEDNVSQEQTGTLTVSGKDSSGNVHDVVITVKASLADINKTTPDKVDLTGKQVNVVTPSEHKKMEK